MALLRANQVFDEEAFHTDVRKFKEKQDLTWQEMADRAEVSFKTMTNWMEKRYGFALRTVYALGKVCDLDMNKYML